VPWNVPLSSDLDARGIVRGQDRHDLVASGRVGPLDCRLAPGLAPVGVPGEKPTCSAHAGVSRALWPG
jgi:hypothetical protein